MRTVEDGIPIRGKEAKMGLPANEGLSGAHKPNSFLSNRQRGFQYSTQMSKRARMAGP